MWHRPCRWGDGRSGQEQRWGSGWPCWEQLPWCSVCRLRARCVGPAMLCRPGAPLPACVGLPGHADPPTPLSAELRPCRPGGRGGHGEAPPRQQPLPTAAWALSHPLNIAGVSGRAVGRGCSWHPPSRAPFHAAFGGGGGATLDRVCGAGGGPGLFPSRTHAYPRGPGSSALPGPCRPHSSRPRSGGTGPQPPRPPRAGEGRGAPGEQSCPSRGERGSAQDGAQRWGGTGPKGRSARGGGVRVPSAPVAAPVPRGRRSRWGPAAAP